MGKMEKTEASGNRFRAYCFPALSPAAETREDGEETAGDIFQPLYDSRPEECLYQPSAVLASGPDRDQHDDTAERRQKSYRQGMIAGQRDAQCLAGEEVRPRVQEFVSAVNRLRDLLGYITGTSSRNTVQLALEIVGKVLGDCPALDDQSLNPVYQEIADSMNRSYGVNLRMNADDLESLSAILQCGPALTLDGDGVHLTGDDRVHKGALCLDKHDQGLPLETVSRRLTLIVDRFPPP